MTGSIAKIAGGDRAPDFWLPNPEGKFGQFYDRFNGNSVLLFFYPTCKFETVLSELLEFEKRNNEIVARNARLVAVSTDSVAINSKLVDKHGIEFTLFSDPKKAITGGYGVDTQAADAKMTDALATFVIDRNQRVLTVIRNTREHAKLALAYLNRHVEPPSEPQVVSGQAPVLLVPNVFDAELCARLIEDWRKDHYEGEVVSGNPLSDEIDALKVDTLIKKRQDHKPKRKTNVELIQLVGRRIAPEVYRAFQFKTTYMQPFIIGSYAATRNDQFKPHRDNTTKKTENRRFAITLNLNEDYEGGFLRFPEFGDYLYRPPLGGAVIFSCSLLHEAIPVTRGQRFVALSFMFGQEDRPQKPALR